MTSTTQYGAEERSADEAAPELLALWSRNLRSIGSHGPAKLAGFYQTGPAGPARVVLLTVGDDGGTRAVGCQGVGFRRVACNGSMLRAALLADLAVDPEHRTLLPVLTLVRRAREIAAVHGNYQYGFPNGRALPVLERVGYRRLGAMVRRVRVLRIEPYLGRTLPGPLARAGGALGDGARWAIEWPGRFRASRGWRLEISAGPVPRIDGVWEQARSRYPVIAERTAEFLRWRFFGDGGASDMATLVREGDGAPRAYAVVTRRGDVAHLSDFLGSTDAELEALLRLLPGALRARGCTSASVRFLGTARIHRLLERCGFSPRDSERMVIQDVTGVAPPVAAALSDVESRYLTDADEDA